MKSPIIFDHFKHIPRHILLIICIGGQTRPNPWHLNNASCKQARDMRSLCSQINTPQSSSQTPSTKYIQPEVQLTVLGAEWVLQGRHPVGYWGEALKGGQWPHCPPAFWTVTLWRLSTHTYTWSKLKPLWPTAQAQYDPLFQHQHNFCGLKHKRVSPAASLFLSLICSKELRLCRTTSSHPDNPSAPGDLASCSLCTCCFALSPAWLYMHLVLVVKYIDWLFQLLFAPPVAFNLSEMCIASICSFH